jgi:hypothetical protein
VVSGPHTFLVGEDGAVVHNCVKALRAAARAFWARVNGGVTAASRGLDIHHRIPLAYRNLFSADPNRRANLIGVSPGVHHQINAAWATWARANPNPTAAQVMRQAISIDRQFSGSFVLP